MFVIDSTDLKHKYTPLGYNVFDPQKTGESGKPEGYGSLAEWDTLLIFSRDPIEVGGLWTADYYTGRDGGWFGITNVYPVHITNTFVGMENINGRNCAKITFILQGGRQERFQEKERYDRSTWGSGIMYFDTEAGVICYYHKELSFHNKEEVKRKRHGIDEWYWRTTTNRTTKDEFTLELKAIITPKN